MMKTLFTLSRCAFVRLCLAVAIAAFACDTTVLAAQDGKVHTSRVRPPVPDTDDPAQSVLDADDARFFLTRVGFAPDSSELAPYVGLTREQAVHKILSTTRTVALTPLPDWVHEPIPTRDEAKAWTPEQRQAQQRIRGERYEALRAWWVQEMVSTPSPLTERMTLFWHNHFTSAQDKVAYPQIMAQQNILLRREALGNFGELLHDVAKDPAMLQYLDGAGSRKGKPNENFAREAMELFTLGEGHYTQQDVSEAARAYTGWALNPDTQAYMWRADLHDDGIKALLGRAGSFDGDEVLDILLEQPETATFITTKLWREFVSDTPDPAAIAPIADRFRESHYDIKVALHALFLSDAFWDESHRGTLVKSPAEFVVDTVRTFDVSYDGTAPFAGEMRTLGENLFYPPSVKGWPGGATWINSSTLLARMQFVEQLFRATETASERRDPNGMGRNPKREPPMQQAGARAVAGGMRFDIDRWLANYNTAPTAKPGLSVELQLQHAVLPLTPVDAIDTDSTGGAYLEALLMDPAYQMK